MGRANFNEGQEIKKLDLNRITYAMERQFYERFFYNFLGKQDNAFFGTGFSVSRVDANTIEILTGLGLQRDNTQVSPQSKIRPIFRAATGNEDITAADPDDDRIDIVVVKNALIDEIEEERKYKDAIDSEISLEDMVVQTDWEADILIVAGTPDPSPVPPSVPAGYIKIATILVTAATGIANANDITDERVLMPELATVEMYRTISVYPATLTSNDSKQFLGINSSAARAIEMPPAENGERVTFVDETGLMDVNPTTLTVDNTGTDSFYGTSTTFELASPYGSWTFECDVNKVWRLVQ